jgi:hypothetical protein
VCEKDTFLQLYAALTRAELKLRVGQLSHATDTVHRMHGSFKALEEFMVPANIWGILLTNLFNAWRRLRIPAASLR